MSSTRPLLDCEQSYALGHPLNSYASFFGLTFGILTHLRIHKIQATQNWFPTAHAKVTGGIFIGGGLILGAVAGHYLFHDRNMLRAIKQNKIDQSV
eukprot:CAMPEP_0170487152 /NCGR_PEP_ID=MMETSP0208-20121228/6022_1 /TAXON_ID=197538 /ORGANISM="Strombidium inclinatum, Strain S3" /LENGTH=95 /DNA_ID=CAMNT_0010761337 /DNA_START=30 /DNA_END=317 /DNA_ORIENTATION=-